jgi:hypothetical protein
MARPRKPTPRYLEHKQSGRGRAVWTDNTGKQRELLLPGPYGSDGSRKAYGRLLLEMHVSPLAANTSRRTGTDCRWPSSS